MFFRISFFVALFYINSYSIIKIENTKQWVYGSCKTNIYTNPPFKAVKIKEHNKKYLLDYNVLVYSYCAEIKDYLKLNVEKFVPIKIDYNVYKKEVKKIEPPFGNQGISFIATLKLDSLSLGECNFLKPNSKNNLFKITSEGICWVGINAPGIHEGFILEIVNEKKDYKFKINKISVSIEKK